MSSKYGTRYGVIIIVMIVTIIIKYQGQKILGIVADGTAQFPKTVASIKGSFVLRDEGGKITPVT